MENTRISRTPEELKQWTLEWSRTRGENNINYILRGDFVPVAYDIDLQTIERFVFNHGGFFSGRGLVIDRMHGRVYYNHSFHNVQFLDFMPFSAEFIEEDLDRLINTIEESNLRNWQEFYAGRFNRGTEDGGRFWSVGILFSDGSILRTRGSGDRNYLPPEDEFAILFNFIETLGEEIIQRHELERLVE